MSYKDPRTGKQYSLKGVRWQLPADAQPGCASRTLPPPRGTLQR